MCVVSGCPVNRIVQLLDKHQFFFASLVCTSPLAVITVVGLLDVLMVSNSEELVSFLLTMCTLAPESATNSLSSGSFVDAARSTHSSAGKLNAALFFL